jgi:hypothetical protein
MDCCRQACGSRASSALVVRLLVGAMVSASACRSICGAENGRSTIAANDSGQVEALIELKTVSFDQETVRKLGSEKHFNVFAGNPVLAPGKHGEWDAGAIGSMTITLVDGVLHMYYEAWGASASGAAGVDYSLLQIGHAISLDGIHWRKDPANPVLPKGAATEWDAKGTWDPFILHENGVFKLWFGGGIDTKCDWGYADSHDGTHFAKRGQISHLGQLEDDHVVHRAAGEPYYMYYWDRQHEPYGLFRAESADETHFDFAQARPIHIDGEPADGMFKFTHVVVENGAWYMLYANFVRPTCADSTTRLAVSTDGLHWKSVNKNLFAGHDADILKLNDSLYLAYFGPQGHFDQKDSDVRVAILSGTLSDLIGNAD